MKVGKERNLYHILSFSLVESSQSTAISYPKLSLAVLVVACEEVLGNDREVRLACDLAIVFKAVIC